MRLLNDFEATAYGIANVASDAVVTLHEGVEVARAPRAVLGAGTGLGEAVAYYGRARATRCSRPKGDTPTSRRATTTRSRCFARS